MRALAGIARTSQPKNGPFRSPRPPLPSGAQKGAFAKGGTVPIAAVRHNQPGVVDLADRAATDPELTGAKAAALAKATGAGLPVLPGMVITTAATERSLARGELRTAWERLSGGGRRAVVVRSSSTAEDGSTSSMAGQFTSVLDVRSWHAFLDAVHEVVESGAQAATG